MGRATDPREGGGSGAGQETSAASALAVETSAGAPAETPEPTGEVAEDNGPDLGADGTAEREGGGRTEAEPRTVDRSRRGPMMRAAKLKVFLVAVSYPSR
jgi:hypothetical protein